MNKVLKIVHKNSTNFHRTSKALLTKHLLDFTKVLDFTKLTIFEVL